MFAKTIAIEGSDSAGKQTQSNLLCEHLKRAGCRAVVIGFPRYGTPTGDECRAYLNGKYGDPVKLDPLKAAKLYHKDRQAALPEIESLGKENDFIIFDRFKETNLPHQAAKGRAWEEKMEIIRKIEAMERDIPDAEFTVFLHVPADVSDKLKPNKEDRHESNLDYQRNVRELFDHLCENKGWARVECTADGKMLSREAIHKMVYKKVCDFFKLGLDEE